MGGHYYQFLLTMASLATAVILALVAAVAARPAASPFPLPFTRPLMLASPPLAGSDVVVLQGLLLRANDTTPQTGAYDALTAAVVAGFQAAAKVGASPGTVDPATAAAVLQYLADDNYKDDGQPASARGYLFVPPAPEMNSLFFSPRVLPAPSF